MVSGTPNLEIHPENNAASTSVVAVLVRGMASIHLLVLSMMVRMWMWPKEIVSGPTRSMWMWANLRWGTGIGRGLTWTCWWMLDCWHFAQSLVQAGMSPLIPDQTNLEHKSCFVTGVGDAVGVVEDNAAVSEWHERSPHSCGCVAGQPVYANHLKRNWMVNAVGSEMSFWFSAQFSCSVDTSWKSFGSFSMVVAAVVWLAAPGGLGGQHRASATTFWGPGRYLWSEVNLAMAASLTDQGSEIREIVVNNGLWSVHTGSLVLPGCAWNVWLPDQLRELPVKRWVLGFCDVKEVLRREFRGLKV